MKRVAVTGATSMIGAALIEECVRNGIEVIAFVRRGSVKLDRLPDSPLVRTVEAELNELGAVEAESGLQADNIQYTLDAVNLAERMGCKRFIGAGSQAEYGVANEVLTADTAAKPVTPYGIAKLAAGSLSRIACEQKGMEHIWVRVLSIYGVHDKPNTLISQLVQHALQDEPMELSGCEQTWDYLYESDAGRAFLETGRRGVAGKIYVLGSGDGRRLKSYVDELTEMVNRDYRPDFGKKPYGPTQPMHLQADIAELTEDTGWKPLVSFAEGVREMLALQKKSQK